MGCLLTKYDKLKHDKCQMWKLIYSRHLSNGNK